MKLIINSLKSLEDAQKALEKTWLENRYLTVSIVAKKKRTSAQNRALHKWLKMVSDEMIAAGLDMRKTLKIDMPATPYIVKEFIWRPVQNAVLAKNSTTKLTTKEVGEIYEILNLHLGEKLGIHVPWPGEARSDE